MVLRVFWNVARGIIIRNYPTDKTSIKDQTDLKKPLFSLHIWKSRAGFLDLDLNFHMNNASYLYCAELARWEWSTLIGLFDIALRKKWAFIVGGQAIRYCRPIPPFEKYEIHSRILAYDEKWVYIEQIFQNDAKKKVYAVITIRSLLQDIKTKKSIKPEHLFEELKIAHLLEECEISRIDNDLVRMFNVWNDSAWKRADLFINNIDCSKKKEK